MVDESVSARSLVDNSRLEVLPTKRVFEAITANVPMSRTVTVTASPAKGLEPTLAMADQLARQGYRAVPHIAARMVGGRSELSEIVARLTDAGVESVFVPGGDAEQSQGSYPDALRLLEDLDDLGRPFKVVGVAGYPERHPTIDSETIIADMAAKSRYADEIVSNLCLSGATVKAWIKQVRRRGIDLPIRVGMAGNVERRKLVTMAAKIGVGQSSRFASKNLRLFARILAPGGFRPGPFLHQVESAAESFGDVSGLHVYTFNQLVGIEEWIAGLPSQTKLGNRLGRKR